MIKTDYKLDATDQSMGRIATEASLLLRGKNDPQYAPHLTPKNKVVISNASKVKITSENKLDNKIYYRHSGYPGGLKSETRSKLIDKKGASEVLRRAIYGMLPTNKLRKIMMNNLTIEE